MAGGHRLPHRRRPGLHVLPAGIHPALRRARPLAPGERDARCRGARGGGTETSLLGPFFREKAPEFAAGESIATRDKGGEEIILSGTVTDAAGTPIPEAGIDIWQVDATGLYDLQSGDAAVMDMRGRFRADAEGRFHMRTVRPIGYSVPMDGPVGQFVQQQGRHGLRPGHIHVLVQAPGYRELVTALYMADDPSIDSDTVFGVARSLVVRPERGLPGAPRPDLPAIRYDFRLSRLDAEAGGGRVGADPSQMMPAGR